MNMVTATHQETYIGLLPFFHSYGMVGLMLSAVESGAKLVTLPRFDVPSFLQAIDDHQVYLKFRFRFDFVTRVC